MKIYTKTGDKGKTGLLGGTRVDKHALRIEAYGTLDELNAWVGLLISHTGENEKRKKILAHIQDRLFTLGALLAADPEKNKMKLPTLNESDWEILETEMDDMTGRLPELKSFILPGGSELASFSHLARTVCRRAERCVTRLAATEQVDTSGIIYLNRLSDYFFVLSRMILKEQGLKEVTWNPAI